MRYGTCRKCYKRNTIIETHHLLPQSKVWVKLYGDLIHNPLNLIEDICKECHELWGHDTEIEFCRKLKIIPRSREGQQIWGRLAPEDKWEII